MKRIEKEGIILEQKEKSIDLEAVIASKSEKLLKRLPGFVLRYLKRIIHVDEINDFLYRHWDKLGFDFAQAGIEEFEIDLQVEGLDNIPESGNAFVVSNHPLGGFDGVTLLHAASKKRKDILFPVNDILMNLKNMGNIFIPINKHGRNTNNINSLEEAFASDKLLLFFPAGLVSRKQKRGEIKDLEWKHTVINKARKYEREIIPTYIHAHNTPFFYNLAKWRKRLGIKANIEMLFLPDQVYRQHGHKILIRFGKPIPHTYFDKSKSPREWAAWLREHVYNDVAGDLHKKKS